MAGQRGGKREGSGRKPAPIPPKPEVAGDFSAEQYLLLVVRGEVPADPHRIAAARSLLRYEAPVRRLPLPMKSSQELVRSTSIAADRRANDDWKRKEARIRAEHAEKYNGKRGN